MVGLGRTRGPWKNSFIHTPLMGDMQMGRWPRRWWTTLFTSVTMFVVFPILCALAYFWVRGRLY